MRKALASVLAIGASAPLFVGTPAQAATYTVGPCVLKVPAKVSVASNRASYVTAALVSCPAKTHAQIIWTYQGDNPPSFEYDPAKVFPASGLRVRLYSWDTMGLQRPELFEEGLWYSDDYADSYRFAINSNAFTMKRQSDVTLKVAKRGTTRTITATGKRHGKFSVDRAPSVQLFRNGRLWRTLATSRSGTAVIRTTVSGTWQVRLPETRVNWSAASPTVVK